MVKSRGNNPCLEQTFINIWREMECILTKGYNLVPQRADMISLVN